METTVIIPVFNGSDTLPACLQALNRSNKGSEKFHVIVVDNKSTDDTGKIAERLGAEVLSATRMGPASARNIGLMKARTKYVAFLDADCIPAANWVSNLTSAIRGSTHVGVGGALNWRSDKPAFEAFYKKEYPSNADCLNEDKEHYLLTANCILDRKLLMGVGGFNSSLSWSEDVELGIRLAAKGYTFGYAPNAVVELKTPDRYLDVFSQFFKYGHGNYVLRNLFSLHTRWSFSWSWYQLLDLIGKQLKLRPSATEVVKIFSSLGYFSGAVHGLVYEKIQALRQTKTAQEPALTTIADAAPPKSIVFTIDDGPHPTSTPAILEELKASGIKASFFLTGERAEQYPHLVAEIVAQGHDVFNHGYSHRRMDCLSKEEILLEVSRTEEILKKSRPTPTPYFLRLPYGAGANDQYVIEALKTWNEHVKIVQWNLTFHEWDLIDQVQADQDLKRLAARALAKYFPSTAKVSGNIALLHESPYGICHPRINELCLELMKQTINHTEKRAIKIKKITDHQI